MYLPFGMTFRDALLSGHAGRGVREAQWYIDLVKTMPCCVCQARGVDPHHIIIPGTGYKGFNYKTPDAWAIPLCRQHHDEFHHLGGLQWEQKYLPQTEYSVLTLAQLIAEKRVGPGELHKM